MLPSLFRSPEFHAMGPEILDGPWGIIAFPGGAAVHGWVERFTDQVGKPLETEEVMATKEAKFPWLGDGVGWVITPMKGFATEYATHTRLSIVTSGDIPGGKPQAGGAKPERPPLGAADKGFHAEGWYSVISITGGVTAWRAFMHLHSKGGGWVEEFWWPENFLRPKPNTIWVIARVPPDPDISNLTLMTSTITIL